MPLTASSKTLITVAGNKMTNQDLANFYGISAQAVGRWSKERKHRKRVQALANAEQEICELIASISKLVFIFNCKWLHGEKQVKSLIINFDHNSFMVEGTEFWQSVNMHSIDVDRKLKAIKTKLEGLVYGVSTID